MTRPEIENLVRRHYPDAAGDPSAATFCLLVDVAVLYLHQLEELCAQQPSFDTGCTPLEALLTGLKENLEPQTGGKNPHTKGA